MAEHLRAADLDVGRFLHTSDHIIWGQACGEPTTLIEALVAQRAETERVSVFAGSSFSRPLSPEQADHLTFTSMGAIGTLARLAKAGGAALWVAAAKETVRLAEEMGRSAALRAAGHAYELSYRSFDAQAGPAPFREKRKPQWRGE
ncbi:MAG: acetyl-CoA hydrolase/transferase [Bradyrhizobium sp.]|nr:acetyl-CoA hydrolase/transferase [Bradyrhizobium sp.]